MKFTYLIGNGFDLNLGLKTSFYQFFDTYCNKHDCNNMVIREFKDEIRKDTLMWSDFEFQMGQYANKVVPLGTLTIEDYFTCMEDFRKALVTYLSNEENRINTHAFINKSDAACHRAIEYPFQYMRLGQRKTIEQYLSRHIKEPIEYNFIVFNYTRTFEMFLSPLGYNVVGNNDIGPRHWINDDDDSVVLDKLGEVVHVHGRFEDVILLGVNDEQQVDNPELIKNLDFRWNYIKPIANEILGGQQDIIAKQIIYESDIIFIYGMSIGHTDKTWWQSIIKWLSEGNYSREHFLIIFSYDPTLMRSSPLDNIKNQKQIEDKLFSFAPSFISMNKNQLKKHMFCSLNSDIFKLDFDPFEP